MLELSPPFLSAYDPALSAEGGIDPLGLAAVYERLANRVLPHVAVRMRRPRFVTAVAAGAMVCDRLIGEMAADGRTPGWMVFEWYVVEGLVRCLGEQMAGTGSGLPGISKVGEAVSRDGFVNHQNYLRTASVFGFTGVYRRLAEGMLVIRDDGFLDEAGYELLRTWEEEQGIPGFVGGHGPGQQLRERLLAAVEEGLRRGHTARSGNWQGFSDVARLFAPDRAGSRERRLLWQRFRSPYIRSGDPEATSASEAFFDALERRGRPVSREEEASVFRTIRPQVGDPLARRLQTIDAYEALARPITDAFDLIRWLSSQRSGMGVTAADFGRHALARRLIPRVASGVRSVEQAFSDAGLLNDVSTLLTRYGDVTRPEDLYDTVLDHHEEVQHNKPPEGKRPWFERLDGAVIRPRYAVDEEPSGSSRYVHEYRSPSASAFLADVGRIRP